MLCHRLSHFVRTCGVRSVTSSFVPDAAINPTEGRPLYLDFQVTFRFFVLECYILCLNIHLYFENVKYNSSFFKVHKMHAHANEPIGVTLLVLK